jgi:hypothetical protein
VIVRTSQNIRPPDKPLGALGHALKDALERKAKSQGSAVGEAP